VTSQRVGLADAEAKREFSVELGMGQEEVPACVETLHQRLVRLVSGTEAEADEIEFCRRASSKRASLLTQATNCRQGVRARECDAVILNAVMPDHEPELQGAKAPPNWMCQSR